MVDYDIGDDNDNQLNWIKNNEDETINNKEVDVDDGHNIDIRVNDESVDKRNKLPTKIHIDSPLDNFKPKITIPNDWISRNLWVL